MDVLRAIGATGAAPNEVEGLLCLSHRAMVVMGMPRVDEVVGAPAANQRMVVAIVRAVARGLGGRLCNGFDGHKCRVCGVRWMRRDPW